ncbi:LysR substrate-binding domain-containing protein [Lentzea indica]|uniref:LysR substrate-binding domain-containing protein n=1 Tax=Lentzea indica TaxID=2604800 RepID=UPI0028A864EB|nr:LysR substrate-binding domain-containing protein [Lentzea indica]
MWSRGTSSCWSSRQDIRGPSAAVSPPRRPPRPRWSAGSRARAHGRPGSTRSRPRASASPPDRCWRCPSTTAIKAAAIGGIGPAVLSLHTVATDIATRTLVRVEVSDLDLHRALRAVWPAGRTPRGPASDLLTIATRTLTHRADRR